jgi:exodeoxyribonuclease VII small subunit
MPQKTPSKAAQDAPAAVPEDFEQALAELEQLVAAMEGGALSLEASLAAYERGATLARFCQERLSAAEQQVKLLEGDVLRVFQATGDDDAR